MLGDARAVVGRDLVPEKARVVVIGRLRRPDHRCRHQMGDDREQRQPVGIAHPLGLRRVALLRRRHVEHHVVGDEQVVARHVLAAGADQARDVPCIDRLDVGGAHQNDARSGRLVVRTLPDRAQHHPIARIHPACIGPAAGQPVSPVGRREPAGREDQRGADQRVGVLAPDLLGRPVRPVGQHPVMRDDVDIDPGGGGAAAPELDGDVDHGAVIGLHPSVTLGLEDVPQPGLANILDGLVRDTADALGLRRALAEYRDQRSGGFEDAFSGGLRHRRSLGIRPYGVHRGDPI